MKKVTRIVAAITLLCMALILCACEQTNPTTTGTQAPAATTTAPVPTTDPVPTTTVDDGKVEYRVIVLYPDGSPVVGKSVAVCENGESGQCSMPVQTDENGVALVRFYDLENCGAKVLSKIDGYQKMEDYVFFEAGSREVTITLVPEE